MGKIPLTKADLAGRLIHKVNTYTYIMQSERTAVLDCFFLSALSTNENSSY